MQFYWEPVGDEEEAADVILAVEPIGAAVDGLTAHGVAQAALAAPLDAYTARVIPRDAAACPPAHRVAG